MSEIKLTADSGGGTTSIKAPSSTTSDADVVLKLPVADGSSGQVLKTDGSGQLSFTSNAGTTINNNADNRVITGSGTANTLEGESNLTFSGGATGDATLTVHAEENNNASEAFLKLEVSNDFAESIVTAHDSSGVGGSLKYNHGDNAWRFTTNNDIERMRIDSSGRVGINNTNMSSFNDGMDDLVIGNGVNGTSPGMTIYSNSSDIGSISFIDGANTNVVGLIQYRHLESSPYMRVMVENSNIAKFTTDGICFGSDTAAANALDDYEEGTFTPSFANVDNSVITVDHYNYTKIGRLVHINAKFTIGSNNDGSRFGFQLPFTQAGSRKNVISAISTRSGSNTAPFAFVINSNQSYAYGYELDGFGDSQTAYATFSGDSIFITGTYEAA